MGTIKAQVHLVDSDKPSHIAWRRGESMMILDHYPKTLIEKDDEIKEYDWFISPRFGLMQAGGKLWKGDKIRLPKIVATTNPELWTVYSKRIAKNPATQQEIPLILYSSEGIAKIDISFVEAYIDSWGKSKLIREVLLKDEYYGEFPKLKRLKLRANGSVITLSIKEQMYSRSQIEKSLDDFINYTVSMSGGPYVHYESIKDWFVKNYPEY
jgi:hypothetical protein